MHGNANLKKAPITTTKNNNEICYGIFFKYNTYYRYKLFNRLERNRLRFFKLRTRLFLVSIFLIMAEQNVFKFTFKFLL